jgi:hypothetical protein
MSMRLGRLTFGALLIQSAAAWSAPDQLADSWCPLQEEASVETVWTIDDDVITELNASAIDYQFDYADVKNMVDQVLQDLARRTRGRVRARVSASAVSSCTVTGGTCIKTDGGVDPQCAFFDAHAGCASPGDCELVLCMDRVGTYELSNLQLLFEHEIGHTYGLHHVTDADETTCNVGGGGRCSTSDGCDGEIMCQRAIPCSTRSGYMDGDGRGIRDRYNGAASTFYARPIRPGTMSTSMSGYAIQSAFSGARNTVWAPRMDCTAENANPTNDCAMVQTDLVSGIGHTKIVRLADRTSTAWTTHETKLDFIFEHGMQPDIAINNDGTVAYVATSNAGNVDGVLQGTWIWGVNLGNGAHSLLSLGYKSALPPRIAYYPELDSVIVVGMKILDFGQRPEWAFHRVTYNIATNTTTLAGDIDEGSLDAASEHVARAPASDFDLDCRTNLFGPDECGLVAILHEKFSSAGNVDRPLGSIRSREFSVSAANVATFAEPTWRVNTSFSANAILGVTLSQQHMYVAAGRVLGSGTDTLNTRLIQFAGVSVEATATNQQSVSSDPSGCDGGTYDGLTMSAATQHGGYSIAYCPSCGTGVAATIQSLHMGPATTGGTNAVCF